MLLAQDDNAATALAWKAIGEMKNKMTETIATPSSSSHVTMAGLGSYILKALPKQSCNMHYIRYFVIIVNMNYTLVQTNRPCQLHQPILRLISRQDSRIYCSIEDRGMTDQSS